MTDYYNAWKEMFTNSQKMMNDWMGGYSQFGNEESTNEKGFDFSQYQDFMNFQQKWFKDWMDLYQNMGQAYNSYKGPYETWMNMMNLYNPFELSKMMNPFNREVFEKIQNSQKLYLGLYDQWKYFNNNFLKPGTEQYKNNINTMVEQFNKIFTNNFIPLMPKELQSLMTNIKAYLNTYYKSMENFLGPWAFAYQNIADITAKALFEDPMVLSDTLKQWKEAYDKTYGILIKSPVVGSARELLEQNNKAINAMIEMLVAVSEYMTKTSLITSKYSKEFLIKYADSLEEGEEVKTFKEFYDMWSKYVEDAIETYFYTDEFAELIAKTTNTSMVFKIEFDKVIEKSLSNLPIVTKSQVDSVYEKVYQLRRELRDVKKELEDLKTSINQDSQKN